MNSYGLFNSNQYDDELDEYVRFLKPHNSGFWTKEDEKSYDRKMLDAMVKNLGKTN